MVSGHILNGMEKMLPHVDEKDFKKTATEFILSKWNRSLCTSAEYPAFDNLVPAVLPDMLTEQLSEFMGYACYETTFELDKPMMLFLEISDTSGGVEVFMNGENTGMRIKPPYHYDLTSFARKGTNYLAVEVAINLGQKDRVTPELIQDKTECGKKVKKPSIIGSIRLYAN
jgi:hypothetical protein